MKRLVRLLPYRSHQFEVSLDLCHFDQKLWKAEGTMHENGVTLQRGGPDSRKDKRMAGRGRLLA